jgi:hypothetical protein
LGIMMAPAAVPAHFSAAQRWKEGLPGSLRACP